MKQKETRLVYIDQKGVHISKRAILYGAGVTALGTGMAIFGSDIAHSVANLFNHESMPTARECTYYTNLQEGESSALEAFQRATGGAKPIDERNPNQLYIDAEDAWLRKESLFNTEDYNLNNLDNIQPGQKIYWTKSVEQGQDCPPIENSR